MQVARRTSPRRKPRRWPFVIALGALLVFCLTVPRYWRSTEAPTKSRSLERPRTITTIRRASKPRDAVLDLADLLAEEEKPAAVAPPSEQTNSLPGDIELFAQLSAGILPNAPLPDYAATTWPTPADVLAAIPLEFPNEVSHVELPAPEPIDFKEQLSQVFDYVGRELSEYAPKSLVGRAVKRAVSSLSVPPADWPVIADTFGDNRSFADATAPLMDIRTPAVAASSSSSVWSVPDLLLAQLQQLTYHSHSRDWATETLTQLRALVETDPREAAKLAALLEGLSSASSMAIKLAEQTDDEPLRVELLRVHWALQRRLDCWTAMRDIRMAAISRTRFASRGPIGPLYGDSDEGTAYARHLQRLSTDLESYELTREPQLARQVAQAQRELRTSSDDLDRGLADAVENNYRNANIRVALTGQLLNRFVSQERAEAQSVNDRIVGTLVRGQSETVSRTRLELMPAIGRWQMQLRTEGTVESDTSTVGRAKLYTHGSTQFTAHTPIVVDAEGVIHKQSTNVSAENCSQLLCVTTGIDWIPLVGGIARQEAVSQYKQKRPQAKAEVEYKVESRTMERVDTRTDELVADVERQVKDRFTNPLAKYGIEVTPLEMTTTTERLVARLRIAGSEQLAGHTPRPRALSDSLASLQLHESALTNAAVALELNGERLTASQLQARMREKLPRLSTENPPEATDDTIFQFASSDAVQFRIDGGRLELILSITEFVQENDRIRNFVVHAQYKPVINGMTAELVRDEELPAIEGRITSTQRARLHNVFKIVLAEDRRLPIFRPDNPNDPRLAGLMITQLVLEDGWLGVSIGPSTQGRVAEQQRSLR